jgi:transposase
MWYNYSGRDFTLRGAYIVVIPDLNNPITRGVMMPEINHIYNKFEKMLGIEAPLYIKEVKFDHINLIVNFYVSYHPKARFTCECGEQTLKIHHKYPRNIQTINLLNYSGNIVIHMPSISCPKCDIKTIPLSWVERGSKIARLLECRLLAMTSKMSIALVTKITGIAYKPIMRVLRDAVKKMPGKIKSFKCSKNRSR